MWTSEIMTSHFPIRDTVLGQLSNTVFLNVTLAVLKPTIALIHITLYAEGTSNTCQKEERMDTELWRAILFFHSELLQTRKSRVCACAFIPRRGH